MRNKVMWFEVLGKDGNKLKKFYGELFGWQYKDAKEMNYGMTDPEATGIGGGVGEAPAGIGLDDVLRLEAFPTSTRRSPPRRRSGRRC